MVLLIPSVHTPKSFLPRYLHLFLSFCTNYPQHMAQRHNKLYETCIMGTRPPITTKLCNQAHVTQTYSSNLDTWNHALEKIMHTCKAFTRK